MKITDIKTFFVDPGVTVDLGDTKNWLFIRIETDEGIRGWGECYTLLDRERSIAAYVDHVGHYLVGPLSAPIPKRPLDFWPMQFTGLPCSSS